MSAQLEIRAPAEQTEGTRSQVLRWLKGIGEAVTENEPLIEIETDKVTVEIAAPGSGTLRQILKQEQEEIGPGDLLGVMEPAGTATAGQAVGPAGLAAAGGSAAARAGSAAHAEHDLDSLPQSAGRSLSPAVRRLLAERGLQAMQVRGTGQGGRITVEDVLAAGAAAAAPGSPPGSAAAISPRAQESPSTAGKSAGFDSPGAAPEVASLPSGTRSVPHTATRKRIAQHMVQSLLHTAPHVTTVFEADLAPVLAHRQQHKVEFQQRGVPLTLTAYFLRATVAAIRAVPEANSRWTDTALEIFESMHIGVATALPTGLVAPVLRDVQSRDLFEVAQGLHDLTTRAREGRLTPADMRDGTFTISNHGVSGSLLATPIIINQPQSAILGVGKLEKRAVVLSDAGADRIVVSPRCYVTLTLDHRVMDGHQANFFLQTFVASLATQPG